MAGNFIEPSIIRYNLRTTGSPILKDIAGYLDCKVFNSCNAGDHTIFVGEVLDAEAYEKNIPLLYRHADFFRQEPSSRTD